MDVFIHRIERNYLLSVLQHIIWKMNAAGICFCWERNREQIDRSEKPPPAQSDDDLVSLNAYQIYGRLHDSARYFACFVPYPRCRGPPEKILSDTHAVAKREIDGKGYRYEYRDEKPRHGTVGRLPRS